MKLFNFAPRVSVCKECGNHFDPLPEGHGEYQWRELCAEHRKPHHETHIRCERVLWWARANWERLEKQMAEEQARAITSQVSSMAANLAANQYTGAQYAGACNPFNAFTGQQGY